MSYLDSCSAVVHVHPALHPSTKLIALPWPGFMMEFVFDTTRAAVNLVFSGACERYSNIRYILSHGGGTMPYISWRLSVSPMIDPRLKQRSPQEILTDFKSFWYDSALVPAPQPMSALSRVAAQEQIIFGSDWPFCNERVVAEEVKAFTAPDFLGADTVAMIGRKNALQLFPQRA